MRTQIATIIEIKITANPPIPDRSLPRKDKSILGWVFGICFSPCVRCLVEMGISPDRVAQGESFSKGND